MFPSKLPVTILEKSFETSIHVMNLEWIFDFFVYVIS